MKLCKIIVVAVLVFAVAGCGGSAGGGYRGMHYSELVDRLGEPREVISDGTGGKIVSYSAFPVDDAALEAGHFRRNVYRVNAWGYVYDLP